MSRFIARTALFPYTKKFMKYIQKKELNECFGEDFGKVLTNMVKGLEYIREK